MQNEIVLKKGLSLNCYYRGTIVAIYTNHSQDIKIKVLEKFDFKYFCIIDFSNATTLTIMCDNFEIEGEEE